MRPCSCGTCRLCWLADNDPRYQRLWGLATGNSCIHRGGDTGDTVQCGTCKGGVRIKLLRCAVHGQCTLAKQVDGVRCCDGCRDRQEVAVGPRWCVGVTTVPERRDELLPQTLASLEAGGFGKPRLFVDSDMRDAEKLYSALHCDVTTRWPRIRTYGNWVLALWEMLVRNPECDRFAIFQDDCVCVKNLRQYLDSCQYPNAAGGEFRAPGYWNLMSLPGNEKLANGRTGWYESNQRGWGAVGLVFNREAVLTVLSSRHTVERPLDPQWGHRKIDGGIVTSFMKAGYLEYVHAPSLIQHVGRVSSMGNDQHRPPMTFPGETFDALTLRASA